MSIDRVIYFLRGPQSYVSKYASTNSPSMTGILTAAAYPSRTPLYYAYGLNLVKILNLVKLTFLGGQLIQQFFEP